jgi:rhodanese-related sulfurtransferase
LNQSEQQAILERARARARDQDLPYAGAVTPEEAYLLSSQGAATIVDVRTRFEADYVGRVDGAPLIEWKALGAPQPNPEFVNELKRLGDPTGTYLFLCRSGVRSHAAAQAAAEAGYLAAFNILEGFEGDLDLHKHRGTLGGWRYRGLPWIQG